MEAKWQRAVHPTSITNTSVSSPPEKKPSTDKPADQKLANIVPKSIQGHNTSSETSALDKNFTKSILLPKKNQNLLKKIGKFIKNIFFHKNVAFKDTSKVNVDSNLQFGIITNFEERSAKGKKDVYRRADSSSSARTKIKEHYESLGQKSPNYKTLGIACEFSDLVDIDPQNISFDQACYAVKNFLKQSEHEGNRIDTTAAEYASNHLLDILDEQSDPSFEGAKITNLNDLKEAFIQRCKEKNKTEESLDYDLFLDIYRGKHGHGSAKDLDRGDDFKALKKACDDKFDLDLIQNFQKAKDDTKKYEALFAIFEDSREEVNDKTRFDVDEKTNVNILNDEFSLKKYKLTREALLAKDNPNLSLEEKLNKLLLACANKASTKIDTTIKSLIKGMPDDIRQNPREILKHIESKTEPLITELQKTAWEAETEKTVKFQNVNDRDMENLVGIIGNLFKDGTAIKVLSSFISSDEDKTINSSSNLASFEETDFSILNSKTDNKLDEESPFDKIDQEVVEDQKIIEENMKKARFSLKDDTLKI